MSDFLDKKKEELEKLNAEVEALDSIKRLYPDLKDHRNRWGTIRYCTKAVNGEVTDYDMSHNCGCCPDSPLEVWPYKEINGIKVYSDPCRFCIGEKNPSYGYSYCDCDEGVDCTCPVSRNRENAYDDWHKGLEEAGISRKVIDDLKAYMRKYSDWEE